MLAAICRINALYMIACAGSGHPGTTFSSTDIVSWLYLNELRPGDDETRPRDVYFSSKGHDVPAFYAVMIALERLPSRSSRFTVSARLEGYPVIQTLVRRPSK